MQAFTGSIEDYVHSAPTSVLEALSSKRLKLILLPTEKCNLRCTYCYEDYRHGRMSEAIQFGIEALIRSAVPRLDLLEIDWFGGEPLLASDIVLRLSRAAHEACKARGVAYHGSMTSNATLLDSVLLQKLFDVGVRQFQITLDGDKESHDAQRVTGNGSGTFARVLAAIQTIHQSQLAVSVSLRLHFTPWSIRSVERLLDRLSIVVSQDPRFTCFFHSVEDLGGPGGVNVSKWTSKAEKRKAKNDLEAMAERLSLATFEVGTDYVCYAARANSFVIRSDGRLNKCTVALESPLNQIGRLSPDGELLLDSEQHLAWLAGTLRLDKEFAACPSRSLHERPLSSSKVIEITASQ